MRCGSFGARGLWFLLLAAMAVFMVAQSAQAQTEEELAGARSAATQGAKAFQAGQWEQAIDMFERAESLVHAPPHLLYMARAHEKLGSLVTARELYNKIIREKLAPDAPEAFGEAQAAARAEIQAIEPRLASLTVSVSAPQGVTPLVTMDGKQVPAALLGVPRPVDPGEHVIEASAQGYLPAQAKAVLAEGGADSVTLTLTPDPQAAAAGAAPPDEPASAAPHASPATPEDTGATMKGGSLRLPAYISFGVGAVGLGAGVLFTLQSASKRSDANDKFEACASRGIGGECRQDDPLSSEVADLDDQAGSAQTLAIVGYAVGGLGIAAGVTLLLLDDSSGDSAAHPKVRPFIGYRSLGVTGTF